MSAINEGATSYIRFPVFLAHCILWKKLGLEAKEVVGGWTFLFFGNVWVEPEGGLVTTERLPLATWTLALTGCWSFLISSWTYWTDKPKILSDKGEDSKESFKDSLTEDFSKISLLLERVKLPRVPIRRSWEIPIAWSTWSKKDLSSEKSSPLSWSKDPAADRKCSVVPSAWEVLLRRFSDLDQRACVNLNPSTDVEPRREADFPIDE